MKHTALAIFVSLAAIAAVTPAHADHFHGGGIYLGFGGPCCGYYPYYSPYYYGYPTYYAPAPTVVYTTPPPVTYVAPPATSYVYAPAPAAPTALAPAAAPAAAPATSVASAPLAPASEAEPLPATQASATFTDAQGRSCRTFETSIEGTPVSGTACLQPDGTWRTVGE